MKFKLSLRVENKDGFDSRFFEKEVEINPHNIENGLNFLYGEIGHMAINSASVNEWLEKEIEETTAEQSTDT